MENLNGKTAVITGGNSGVGAATAMLFAKRGANVVISARRQAALDEVAEKIKAEGGNVLTVPTDISKVEDCDNLMKSAADKFGKIDILVNNAGVLDTGLAPVDKFDDAEIQKIISINQVGTMQCIRAALEIVSSNFSYESVMRFLRTGFVDIEERHIDLLDNYLVAIRVRGKNAWKKRWLRKMKDERMCDLELLDQLRIQIADLLIPFYETFEKKSTTVSDKIMALYQLLVSLHAEEKLWIKEEEYLKEGQQDKSKEYGQIYRIVMELLEKYDTLLGAEQISVEEFTEILDAGLSAANVAVIPPGYDSVTLGDIERTRLNGVKVLFFVGVNDGIIPKAVGKGGIISEYERQMLKEAKLELAPGAREQAFIQRFYLYRNLTKPTQLLYLSYVKVDGEGKAIRPSYLIETIKRMFPDLVEQDMEEIFSVPSFYTTEAAKDYLVHGRKDENWYALAGLLLEGEDAEQLNRLISAPFSKYTPDPISKAVAQAIYGKSLKGSVTRLEKYAVCAYKHFLEYGLKLKERELASFENTDMGNLYHDALKRYSDKLEESEYDWFKVPEEARIQLCQEAME